MNAVGKRIRELRQRAALTQEDLAAGAFSASYVSLLEAGKRQASLETLQVLAARLNCSLDDLDPELGARDVLAEETLAFARLAMTHGDALTARDRLTTLLGSPGVPSHLEAEAVLLCARAHDLCGDVTSAERLLRPLFELSLTGPVPVDPAEVAMAMVGFHLEVEDYDHAIADGHRALSAMRDQQHLPDDGFIRFAATLQAAHLLLGDVLLAVVWAHELIDLADSGAAALGRASIRWNAAATLEVRGDLAGTVRIAREALAELATRGGSRDLARLQYGVARWLLRAGEGSAAEVSALLAESRLLLSDLGKPRDLAQWAEATALSELVQVRATQAERLASEALLWISGDTTELSLCLLVILADSMAAQGRIAEAMERYEAAVLLLSDQPKTRVMASLHREVADRMALLGTADKALGVFSKALDSAGIRAARLPDQRTARRRTPRQRNRCHESQPEGNRVDG